MLRISVPLLGACALRGLIISGVMTMAVVRPGTPAAAQQGTQSPRVFEVTSVRRSDPNARGQFRYSPDGTVRINGVSLRLLIQQSYDVRDYQILGGPGWLGSDRYDVTAKAPAGETSTAEDTRLRLQSLLRDRFHLQLHQETRDLARYDLIVDSGGHKLKENAPLIHDDHMSWGAGFLKGEQVDMRFLCVWLSRLIEQPVGDQTGLKSTYDFELRWSADDGGPSIFTATREQLGLKLVPRKGPVTVLVIDSADKPTPD